MRPRRRRWSMQIKLNALVIGNILAVAVGLMVISYYAFCQRADDKYYATLVNAADACANNVEAGLLKYFWNAVDTDEFRELRTRAEEANDEQLILAWMDSQPGYYGEDIPEEESSAGAWTLKDDYQQILDGLTAILDYLEVDSAYYQIDIDDKTYNIADPSEKVFYIGTEEKPIPEFEEYPDNTRIPPTAYRSEFGWLYTAMTRARDRVYLINWVNDVEV